MNQIAFDKLSTQIEKLAGVTSKKRSNKFTYTHNFPFASIVLKKNNLELEFTTPSKIKHTRMKQVKKLKSNKFIHKIAITKEEEVDSQVTGWLLIAHATN